MIVYICTMYVYTGCQRRHLVVSIWENKICTNLKLDTVTLSTSFKHFEMMGFKFKNEALFGKVDDFKN